MANTDRQNEEQRSRDLTRSRQGTEVARRGAYEPARYYDEPFTSPFSMMRRMHEEMDRVFSDLFGSRPGTAGFGGGLATWAPAVEVSERENNLEVCAELPGLKPEDVKVEVTDNAIVIEGERKQEHEEKQGGRWHSERRYGHFCRTIPLPEGADAEHIRADFKNGELHVTVPVNRPQSKRRQIPIGGASTEPQTKK
jgi:HSP20 family protein